MKIYKNKDLTAEIKDNTLDFGIVPAGELKRFTYYVYNEKEAYLKNLKFEIKHDEVRIAEYPTELKSKEIKRLIIEWKPSITLKSGLRAAFLVTGIELWGA